ncbi:hypothetical protein BS78_06G014600 [Paspalum vaginatum]|nr:hypothetical protein BS78_06G014600 [Paspalum vaginatum]
MADLSLDILCWNVHGLNSLARRSTVQEMISASSCHLACLQESKLSTVDQFLAASLGSARLDSFNFKPAGGICRTRGGILLLWNSSFSDLSDFAMGNYHLSAKVTLREAPYFLPSHSDFNFVYKAADKNNNRLNPRLMSRIRDTLDGCDLPEIPLPNKKFT